MVSVRTSLTLCLLAAPIGAQVEAQLFGLTRTAAALRIQTTTCTAANAGCATGLAATVEPWAGGSAYDAQSGGAWISNGNVVARVDPRGCTPACGPWAAPVGIGVVTGLEVLETQNELWVLDSTGTLNRLSLSGSCNGPQIVGSCNTGLGRVGQRATAGLAADESFGLVFYGVSDFAGTANELDIATVANPCAPFQRLPLPVCALGSWGNLRGLAVDSCRHILFATDGLRTLALPYRYDPMGPAVTFGAARCCQGPVTTPDPLVGLAFRPSPGEPVGTSCTNGACRPCPMSHTLLTGATVGNPNLLFALEQAQDNTLTWLALGAGPCRNVGPTIPPLCGPVLVAGGAGNPPAVAGPFPVSGGSGPCQASAIVVVHVPNDPAFCGSDWSSQFLSLCAVPGPNPAIGTALSNCLSFTILGS